MPKFLIPLPGSKFVLTEPWEFRVPALPWNREFWQGFFKEPLPPHPYDTPVIEQTVALPAGIILTVSKIDFRKDDPYHVRFHLMVKDNQALGYRGRFWVSAVEANKATVEPL